ncbi:MAG: hypothetical protein WC234_05750 [Endomicrobiaceae bacterium]
MNYYLIIIVLSVFVILSYMYNIIAYHHKIPSVLLLILTGIITKFALQFLGISFTPSQNYLNIFGTVGLILIVLEGSIDLSLDKSSLPTIFRSLITAFILLCCSSFLIAFIISHSLNVNFTSAFLYAIPLSVISSAIVIPGVLNLDKEKKEFMVCESIFSDILGIMLFNFAIMFSNNESHFIIRVISDSFGTIVISFIISFLLVFSLLKIKSTVKLFPIIAVLVLTYALGKFIHLSTLLLIFVFGLTLRNIFNFIKPEWTEKLNISIESYNKIFSEFKMLIHESSFIIRTFFFIIFGYMLMFKNLLNIDVLAIGLVIIILTYVLRYINLRIISEKNLLPELLIAPRGLITILLYYSIPSKFSIGSYGESIILLVVITTSLLMMFGLIFTKNKEIEVIETTY